MSPLKQPNGTIAPTHVSSLQQPPEVPIQIKANLKIKDLKKKKKNLTARIAFFRFGFVGFILPNFFHVIGSEIPPWKG